MLVELHCLTALELSCTFIQINISKKINNEKQRLRSSEQQQQLL
jgi:cell division protein ZapA (FtsZ GTPase activity inhibitor)